MIYDSTMLRRTSTGIVIKKSDAKRRRYSNWDHKVEGVLLMECIANKWTREAIAVYLGRDETTVSVHAHKLGLSVGKGGKPRKTGNIGDLEPLSNHELLCADAANNRVTRIPTVDPLLAALTQHHSLDELVTIDDSAQAEARLIRLNAMQAKARAAYPASFKNRVIR